MPIRTTIDHYNRVVIGVADGVLTIQDLVAFGLEVLQAKVVHYGKIIDVVSCEPGFTANEMRAFAQILREQAVGRERGPLALVTDPHRGEMARLFAAQESEGRPITILRSLHEARQWLAQIRAEEMAAGPGRPRSPR